MTVDALTFAFVLPPATTGPVGGYRIVYQYASRLAERGHHVRVSHVAPEAFPAPGVWPVERLQRRVRWARARRAGRALWVDPRTWESIHPSVELVFDVRVEQAAMAGLDAVVATSWETAELVAKVRPGDVAGLYLIQHLESWQSSRARVEATWKLPLRKIVIARWLQEHAESMGLSDVVHIPNAIDGSRFFCSRPVEGRPPRVAMLYSHHAWKGTATGIDALQRAKVELPDLEAILFGTSAPPPGVPEWMRVLRNPTQEQLREDVYNASALYLCPSEGEGWHLPPAEAMACGCALVSTDIGGVRDYADHRTARLCPVGDAAALARAIVELATDEDSRQRLAAAGGARIAAFSWERSVTHFEQVLRDEVSSVRRLHA